MVENGLDRYLSDLKLSNNMAKPGGVKPPLFTGRGDEDADSFVSAFDKYIKYREITEDSKKLNLFAVLLKESAAQWLDSLPETSKDTFINLSLAFTNCLV